MVGKLKSSSKVHYKKLSECVEIAKSFGIQIDEDDNGCKEGQQLAEGVMQQITSLNAHEAKLKMLYKVQICGTIGPQQIKNLTGNLQETEVLTFILRT